MDAWIYLDNQILPAHQSGGTRRSFRKINRRPVNSLAGIIRRLGTSPTIRESISATVLWLTWMVHSSSELTDEKQRKSEFADQRM